MTNLQILERHVRGVVFPYPVMIAAGVFKMADHIKQFAQTEITMEWGSIETEESNGNGGKDYDAVYRNGALFYTRNSKGIPNPGIAYVEKHAHDLIAMYADQGKPLVLNISGKGVDDTVRLFKRALKCGFRVITINGACPNKADQPILCFDIEATTELFARFEVEIGATDTLVLWKVSAGMPRATLEHNRKCVEQSNVVHGIVTCNTVPDTFDMDDAGKPTILTEKNKLTRGGMGGPAILPIALGHTEYCASKMPEGKFVFGCGGISNASDAMKFFHAKATVVQVNSAFGESGAPMDYVRAFSQDLIPRLTRYDAEQHIVN